MNSPISFKNSDECSLGIELELQIINPRNGKLMPRAKDLIRHISSNHYSELIKPEITQSMIEINSSVHSNPTSLLEELRAINKYLAQVSQELKLTFCGGGTHPFQMWKDRKIFPTKRFKNLSHRFGYLAKYFTVFGQHIHIGCLNAEDAIYLTQALLRYVPQFLALSASSPFYQGMNSSFDSSRSNVVNVFPTGGYMNGIKTWQEFCDYFKNLIEMKVVESIKDVYWDIRPKPEFGTVEIRVCDTPLTLTKAVALGAYAQTLARYLLHEKPPITWTYENLLYKHNRYQATRYGFDGDFIHPLTKDHISITDDILSTLKLLEPHTAFLKNEAFIAEIRTDVETKHNDAAWLRETFENTHSLSQLVFEQSKMWLCS